MMSWLMRLHPKPFAIDGLLALQITGSPIAAFIAFAAQIPIGRAAQFPKDQ
jgi:hypothetical protein